MKEGHINESISVLSNLKFTNFVNEGGMFIKFLNETQKYDENGIINLLEDWKLT